MWVVRKQIFLSPIDLCDFLEGAGGWWGISKPSYAAEAYLALVIKRYSLSSHIAFTLHARGKTYGPIHELPPNRSHYGYPPPA